MSHQIGTNTKCKVYSVNRFNVCQFECFTQGCDLVVNEMGENHGTQDSNPSKD